MKGEYTLSFFHDILILQGHSLKIPNKMDQKKNMPTAWKINRTVASENITE